MDVYQLIVLLMLSCCGGMINGDGGQNWGYQRGKSFASPDQWKDLPGTSCGGMRQSPINIVNTRYWKELKPVTINKADGLGKVVLKKKAMSLSLGFSETWTITFSGEGCFRPIEMHWHWGYQDIHGSEHRLNGDAYVMEGHVVTYNCALYNSSKMAVGSPSGLYVFAVFYRIGDMNEALAQIVPHIDVVVTSKETTIQEVSPRDFLPKDMSRYYRYEGSLTTPPCTENVIWTVFRDPQSVSINQLYKFRLLQFGAPESGPMGDNFRPPVTIKDSTEYVKRMVYASFQGSQSHRYSACVVIITLLVSTTSSM